MKHIFFIGLILLIGCQEQKKAAAPVQSAVVQSEDDFSDLEKKDDGSCDTTEDLEKKIIEAKKKPKQAFKLQGGDSGCSTK